MQFSFNFDSYEKSGKSKKDAIDYLKTLDSYVNFDKLEKDYNNDDDAIFDQLKKANITFRKKDTQPTSQNTQNTTNNQNANSSTEDTQNNALNANANSQNTTALNDNLQNTTNNQNLNTQINEPEQPLNAKTNQGQGNTLTNEKNTQINAQNTQNEEEQKLAKKEEELNHRGFWEKVKDDFLEETGAGQLMDLANEGLKKLGYDNKDYVTEDEKTQIYDKALNSARQKIANGGSYDDLTPLEKDILAKKDNTGTHQAFAKEQQRSEIEKKDKLDKKDMDLINSDLGFFNTLFNSDKESKKEWEEKRQSEGIISQDIQKAVNTLKQFDEGSLLKNVVFANKDEELQYKKNLLDDAYKIAELNGFNDVGMDKKGDIYFIKTDADGNEKKYLVNTGFFDNFMNMLNDSKFELAGGIAGALKGAKRGTSPMSKALNSIAGGALGSFAGAAADAKLADMYLNRESDFKKNLDYALQAGLLSAAGDGVMLGLTHGMSKAIQPIKTAVDKAGNLLSERTALGFLKTIPTQNIKAAENVIDEVFTPQMKEDLKAAKESLGGAVNGSDLQNPILEKLKDTFTKKYGANDEKTQKIAKLADIFNGNSLKTRQQDMLDLIRSDKEGTTLSYLLEVAKDDVKIQQNLKNMLNLSTSQVKRNLENLKINPYEIKQIMDDFETGNKNAFKEVENQISNLYDDKMKVVLDPSEYNKIKQEFIDNGVPLEEATPFLRDLENNVFSPEGVTFSKLNNFRKNLNYYIYNKDKTPNFVNSVKKLAEGTLKNEIDKGIDNIFKENPAAYDSIKKLYSSSLQDYAAMKELNESVKRLGLQDAQKSTDEVVDNLIKYAKGQGENGVNNLNKIKNYLGKDNHAFLEMQILNRIFKESMVENERAKLSVLDSDKFLNKVKELVGNNAPAPQGAFSTPQARGGASAGAIENENIAKYALNKTEFEKRNALKEDLKSLKDIDFTNENSGLKASLSNTGIKKALSDRAISKSVNNGFNASDHLEAVQDIKNLFEKAHLKQSTEDLKHGDKALKVYRFESDFKDGKALILVKESLDKDKKKIYTLELENLEKHTKPQYALFTSKEAQDFLNIVEGFHKLYKNDASIAKNFTQTTAQKMGTSIATSAEGAIKQKVIKGAFDPIFRLLPEKIFFGMFSKQIQGGALRYHLKKALSRSLNYNDFKLKLEKELQKTHFNSKTKELLNDLMDNLDQFNKTKEEVLNAKALKEQEARDAELALIREQKEKQEEFFKQKEEEFGQEAINNNALKQGEAIEIQGLGNENSHLNASTEPSLQQPLKNTEKIYLKENDEPLNVEYAVVKKDQVKPTFEHGGPQGRTEKQEALINKITNDFNPDLLVSIKGDLKKGNPIILKDGQVLAGNHRSEAIKNLNGEQLERYKKAVKDNFNIDLKDDEMLVRLVKDNDDAKIKRYAFASNEGMENNLSEQSLVLFSKYKNEIDKLKKSDMKFNADDLYNEKNMVMKALGENSLTKLEDTNKALFYSLLRGANANVVKALEELEKQNLEELSKTLSMFYDNAGGFFNITHDTDMPLMSNLQNYLSDAFVKTARKTESRESDFTKLSEDIKAFLNNADKETALKLNPNLVNDLKSQALGVGFARFSRLENPNTNLFDFLKDLKKTFEEKGQPDLFSGKEGTPLNKRNEYDFIEELLLQGQDSKAKFDLINQIRELRDWQNDPAHFKPKEEEIKTTREIINQAKANGLSVKETRKAVEANKVLKEEKLKQEIKEAKEKHNALKENESENSHLKEEETQNPQNPIDNTQNNQNVNSQNQPLKTQPQSKIFNQEENENIRNLEKEYREAYNKWESLEAQNRERIDKWNERLEEDNKNIEEGFKSLGVEALKYDAFNHIFSRYGGLGGTGKNIRNIINDLRPHLTEEELKSLKDNEPLIEKIESLGKEALDLNAKIKDYSVLMREKHKGQHIVKEHREEHEAQQRMHKIREDLNDARVKRAYRLKELIEKNEPIRSKEEYNYINEALSDGPLKIMLDKKIKHLNKKMENFLKADEFNQSTTIQANQHLGAGLFGGMINGLSEDENGNLTFNPQDFLKGFAAGGLGSLGMNKALKVIKQNPQLKRNLLNELKKSLSITHGDLAKVYPVFKNTQRFKATKKDKALNIQARLALKLLEKKRERDYGM